ncbi:diaminopimelate epimerase [soil metagenome]
MRFAKYQGNGNDFVMLADPRDELTLTPELVRVLSDRRFGIGGDGVIRVAPGDDGSALFMDYVNSDGSIGEMCGNGIRCLALFAQAEGMTGANELKVGTRSGTKLVEVLGEDRVRVDMGAPIFLPAEVPVVGEGEHALNTRVPLPPHVGRDVVAACLSMGNPHAVLFVERVEEAPVATLGPRVETHDLFPHKTNVEFVQVDSPGHLTMKVWERGAGQTLACGTGACAAVVASRLVAGTDERVVVSLPGGDLAIEWGGSFDVDASFYMTGPAVGVFDGEVDLDRALQRGVAPA